MSGEGRRQNDVSCPSSNMHCAQQSLALLCKHISAEGQHAPGLTDACGLTACACHVEAKAFHHKSDHDCCALLLKEQHGLRSANRTLQALKWPAPAWIGPLLSQLASEATIVRGLPCVAGTQGRVYRGTLEGERVAVKIVDNASTLRKIGAQHPPRHPFS